MHDKHGNEIKVGDSILHDSGDIGIISKVTTEYYTCEWEDGMQADVEFRNPSAIEVITSVQQETKEPVVQSKTLQQLKLEAQQEIQEIIQKHTALINSAGGNLDINISFYDAKILGNGEPKQLVEVFVSIAI